MNSARPTTWGIADLYNTGRCEVLGRPRLVAGPVPGSEALSFDGLDDGLVVALNPIAGLRRFSIEVVFRPDDGGLPEQRFLHVQEHDSDNRVLFETRQPRPGAWFLDTFIKTGGESAVLCDENSKHPNGVWFAATFENDGFTVRHFLGGRMEMAAPLQSVPLGNGVVSLGMRQNRVSFFRGAIYTVKFSPAMLATSLPEVAPKL